MTVIDTWLQDQPGIFIKTILHLLLFMSKCFVTLEYCCFKMLLEYLVDV